MTTCIVFYQPELDITKCGPSKSRPTQYEIWQFRDPEAEATSIGMDGKTTYDPTLRKSKSVRNKFTVLPREVYRIKDLFLKLEIGVGSKHMYEEGDFMKEHFDSRQPDESGGLPHIMTLILTRDLSHLIVNGKPLEAPDKSPHGTGIYGVLFSLNCPHEVTPVKKPRVSFVFPVFGIYDPIANISKQIKCRRPGKPQSITDHVLTKVEEVIDSLLQRGKNKNTTDELRQMYGYIKALDNENICLRTERLLALDDTWYEPGDNAVGRVVDTPWLKCLYIRDNKLYTIYQKSVNVKEMAQYGNHVQSVEGVPAFFTCLLNLKDDIHQLAEAEESDDDDDEDEDDEDDDEQPEENPEQKQENQVDVFPPGQPFAIICSGRYFQDHIAPRDLTPIDRKIYDRLVKEERKIQFIPVAEKPLMTTFYIQRSGRVTRTPPTHRIGYTTDIWAEFDDSSSYDPRYTLVHGVFLVV